MQTIYKAYFLKQLRILIKDKQVLLTGSADIEQLIKKRVLKNGMCMLNVDLVLHCRCWNTWGVTHIR